MKSSLSKGYGLKIFTDFILMVLVVFLVLVFIGTVKVYHTETFSPNMNNNNKLVPSSFPIDEKQLLLYGDYNIKKDIDVTKNNNSDIWKDYPVYPSSFKQITNNSSTGNIILFVSINRVVDIKFTCHCCIVILRLLTVHLQIMCDVAC